MLLITLAISYNDYIIALSQFAILKVHHKAPSWIYDFILTNCLYYVSVSVSNIACTEKNNELVNSFIEINSTVLITQHEC